VTLDKAGEEGGPADLIERPLRDGFIVGGIEGEALGVTVDGPLRVADDDLAYAGVDVDDTLPILVGLLQWGWSGVCCLSSEGIQAMTALAVHSPWC
jgi:hypothetical protein